ncbi:MAG: WYL domain-containing protein [Actinomycetota bacterium]|nr:WYL domain-containing protein [Actinomycetota bacterium]
MSSVDRLERLADLVLVLMGSARPMTLDEIAHEVPGYPASHEARRQAFERDKRVLREEGIPIRTEPLEGPEQFGYRVDPDSVYLPDLELSPAEQSALHLAVAGVELGDATGRDATGRDALIKLGAYGVAEPRPLVALPTDGTLPVLFDALRKRAELSFGYRGRRRSVAPGELRFHLGYWYLVAWDPQADGVRTYRVDRIEGSPEAGAPGSGEPPAGFDAAAVTIDGPWRPAAGGGSDVAVLVDGIEAPQVIAEVGEQAIVERRSDGSVLLRVGVVSEAATRSWILGLLDHAEVIGPAPARASIVEWLGDIARQRRGGTVPTEDGITGDADGDRPDVADDGVPGAQQAGAQQAGRMSSRVRLRRLLAMVSWLGKVGEAPVASVAERFSMTEDDVVRELELAACFGVPPYTPDTLLEIVVTDGSVHAFLPAALARPRRLTAAEGFALAAAARSIQAVPGADSDGALATALAKLETALGNQPGLVVDLDDPRFLSDVRRAADDGDRLSITYHSASTDETAVRTVDPLAVTSIQGRWYLDAYCHRAEETRRFRVDRISSLEVVGSRRRSPGLRVADERSAVRAVTNSEAFIPGPGAVKVRLVLEPDAQWVVDAVPVLHRRELAGGSAEVTLAVGGTAWLERLLLQGGPGATVVAPSEMSTLGPAAAERILRRYGV